MLSRFLKSSKSDKPDKEKDKNKDKASASGSAGMGCGPSSSGVSDDSDHQQQQRNKKHSGDKKQQRNPSRPQSGSKTPLKGGGPTQDASNEAVSIKSAVLIQKWYRRYKARLEARRRTTWMIYQSIEYSSEASQLHLYNFFSDMMMLADDKAPTSGQQQHPKQQHLNAGDSGNSRFAERLRQKSLEEEDQELLELTSFDGIQIEKSYRGPHLSFPLSVNHVQLLIDSFRQGGVLHASFPVTPKAESYAISPPLSLVS